MNLTGEGWWISVTRTQATQRMKIRLRGTTQGIFLYMYLRLTSQFFPDVHVIILDTLSQVHDFEKVIRHLQETDNLN